jgi:hypothetical protein
VIEGYDYSWDHADQRYFLEVWIEKSTMDDVMEPICRRFGVNLVTGAGFQSITSVISLLRQRSNPRGKPTRILYISDFDPAGEHMPTSTARQIEFWLAKYAPNLEIKLRHLALTREQAQQFNLPRIPIKESDLRRKGFEERNGEGAVELDALEALHPGELARLVREAIQPYFDGTLKERLNEALNEAEEAAQKKWESEVEEPTRELESIRAAARSVAKQYAARLEPIQREFNRKMKPLRERLEPVRHAVQEKANEFTVDLPARPEPADAKADESDWLFDSARDYETQIAAYRRHKEPTEP